MEIPFSTWTGDVQRVSDHYLEVQLYEVGPERQFIAIHDSRRYPVRFTVR